MDDSVTWIIPVAPPPAAVAREGQRPLGRSGLRLGFLDNAKGNVDGSTRSYGDVTNNWDGTWYERVVIQGYPSHLPIDSSHAVGQNTWAFYPLFPRLVAVLMQVTGLAWTPCAGLFSLICAAIAWH